MGGRAENSLDHGSDRYLCTLAAAGVISASVVAWSNGRLSISDIRSCRWLQCPVRQPWFGSRASAAAIGRPRLSRSSRHRRPLRQRNVARRRCLSGVGTDQARWSCRPGDAPCSSPGRATASLGPGTARTRGGPESSGVASCERRRSGAGTPRVDRSSGVRNAAWSLPDHPPRAKELVVPLSPLVALRAVLLPRLGNPRLSRRSRSAGESRLHPSSDARCPAAIPGCPTGNSGHHSRSSLAAVDRSLRPGVGFATATTPLDWTDPTLVRSTAAALGNEPFSVCASLALPTMPPKKRLACDCAYPEPHEGCHRR
jgi:hypothetical protein